MAVNIAREIPKLDVRLVDSTIDEAVELLNEMPVEHIFSDGVYLRTMSIPKDRYVCGHVHKTKHMTVVLTGKLVAYIDGEMVALEAGDVFETPAGSYKQVVTQEDSRVMNIIPTELTDLDEIEEMICDFSIMNEKINSIEFLSEFTDSKPLLSGGLTS